MSKELQGWFKALPGKVQREFAKDFRGIVDGFANELRAAAPVGESGNTRDSVRVTRGKHSLELIVEAGGPKTTKFYNRKASYQREVVIDGRDNRGIGRGNQGVSYDYALAGEFGTQKQAAQPWFYPTYRRRREALREEIQQAQADAIAKA